MSVFTSAGPKRLFGFAAFAAVCVTLLFLSGCGHHCGCNKCHSSNTCNTCNTCNSCKTVGDASTCTTCNQYANVGTAPQTLSEPSTAYSTTSSTYTGTNTSFERVGDSQNLPVFSAPITPTVVPPVYTPPVTPPVQQAALIPDAQVRGGGQYHTLAQGETIYALSRKYGVRPKTILDANHFSDPNHLAVGTRVYIPAN